MNIIVEGPDGAGKTSLVKKLVLTTGRPVGSRQSSSMGGPVPNVMIVAQDELRSWAQKTEPKIYDRFGLISEPIYGPILRSYLPMDTDAEWITRAQMFMYTHAQVIFCLPPLRVIKENLRADPDQQMEGVLDHIDEIYHAYVALYYSLAGRRSANVIKWDYTKNGLDRWIG